MKIGPIDVLDGDGLRRACEVEISAGRISRITPAPTVRRGLLRTEAPPQDLPLLCPAPIDLQVNGGAGRMLGECEGPGDVLDILSAHRRLGAGAIVPTLISDTPATVRRIVDLVETARAVDPGILGLHLEGPHIRRAGAHDPKVLRPMNAEDLAYYLQVRQRLECLMITLDPDLVSPEQISALAKGGVIVSLGHSNCTYETAATAIDAGARMVTHLYNAMSGLAHREPGLVGAAFDWVEAFGLIADGYHVHDAAMRVALAARLDAVIVVSDAMAVAGTDMAHFHLGGRLVTRAGGRLVLEDGTLAGADVSMVRGLLHLCAASGRPVEDILPMGFDRPHRLITGEPNRIAAGRPARLLMLETGALHGFDGQNWHTLGQVAPH